MRAYCFVMVEPGERPSEAAERVISVSEWPEYRWRGEDQPRPAAPDPSSVSTLCEWRERALILTLRTVKDHDAQVWLHEEDQAVIIRSKDAGIHLRIAPDHVNLLATSRNDERAEISAALMAGFSALEAVVVVDDTNFSFGFDLAGLDEFETFPLLFDSNPGWFFHPRL